MGFVVAMMVWVLSSIALAPLIGGMIRLADRRTSSASDVLLVGGEPPKELRQMPRLLRSVS